ncbi:MAG: peptidoglycan-binding domain-containing protein [Acidimicrobiales bacterium]
MTAATNEDSRAPGRTRPLGGRQERLRLRAATAPRPLRIFFEAELGYQLWRPGAEARTRAALSSVRHHLARVAVVAPDGSVSRRTRLAMAPDVQLRLARRLLPVAVTLGVVGVAGTNLRTGGETIVFERLARGDVQAEALAPAASAGTGAEKGAATDGAGPATAGPPATAPATAGAAPAPPAGAPAGRTIPAQRGALPVGKGMWIWLADQVEGGNAEAIVARAEEVGLTHLYVRTASLSQGFYAGPFLDRLLPAAHAANIRVYAWDFPYLDNVDGDVARAVQAITYLTPDGHRVDGYAADVELRSMGVNITAQTGKHFGVALRRAVGPNYPLIACVPRPSPALNQFPYADLVAAFDAIAPMVYWLGQDPTTHMEGAVRDLEVYGKPILPVGQAYDGGGEGGPPGVPSRDELIQFMQSGDKVGAAGVSWWSWQHADQEAWDAIKDAAEFRLPVGDPAAFTPGQVKAYQTLLTSLGFPTPDDGAWSDATTAAVKDYQRAARLPASGVIDGATRQILFTPFAPPVQPQS